MNRPESLTSPRSFAGSTRLIVSRPFHSSVRLSMVVMMLALGCSTGRLPAQSREDLKKPLSPAVEKELTDFIGKCEVEKHKQLKAHMDDVLKAVDTVAKLTPEELGRLQKQAAEAVEKSVALWRPRFAEALRSYLPRRPDSAAIRIIGQWKPDVAGPNEPVEDWSAPDEDPAWQAALRATLGDQRFAAWRRADEAARQKRNAAIADYVNRGSERWGHQYRIALDQSLRMKIESFSKAVNPPQERVAALTKAGQALTERLLDSEKKRAITMLRPMPPAALEHIIAREQFYLRFSVIGKPWDDLWQEELQGIVTADELAAWQRHLAEEKAKFEKELPALLKPTFSELRVQWERALDLQIAYIVRALNWPAQRGAPFAEAKKAALDQAEKKGTELAREQVDSMDNEVRQNLLKRGRFYVAIDESDLPQNATAWTNAIKALLSPEEWKQLAAAKAERAARRTRIMGQVMIAELDQHVAFTVSQRERLKPIAEKLVKEIPDLFRDHVPSHYYDFSPAVFLSAAKRAAEAEVLPVLDAIQWTRWQEASTAAGEARNRRPDNPPPDADLQKRELEPEEVEARVSEFLHQKTQAEKRRIHATMLLQAEDAVRVAALTNQAAQRLRTAAKGATEQALAQWKAGIEQRVRSVLVGATPQTVLQRLGGIDGYYLDGGTSLPRAIDRIWTAAAKSELTDAQRAAWQKEIDARKAFRQQAILNSVMAEFDRRHLLTADQWQKLESMIAKLMADYKQDIDTYFSNSTPWHLQSYSALIPFAGLPEKDLKPILTKEQWECWSGDGIGGFSSYWDSIKEHHERRLGIKK